MTTLNRSIYIQTFKHYLLLAAGAAILAFGMYNIHSRSLITEGGVLGMTLLLQHWFGITTGISGLCLDALCYFLGFRMLGRVFLKNALTASLCFSVFYNLFEHAGYLLPDLSPYPLAAAVLGGCLVGAGVGLVVREGGAAGGDDALALVLSKLLRCKISLAYLSTDITVLLLSLSYIPFKNILYSLVTVTISSFLIGLFQKKETHTEKAEKKACADTKQ